MTPELPMDKILGLVLMLGGGGWLAASKSGALLKWFRNRRTAVSVPGDDGHNSDAAPPEGFSDHVAVILQAAPTAPPGEQVYYCVNGLTEAQVLLAECKRLEQLVPKESAE